MLKRPQEENEMSKVTCTDCEGAGYLLVGAEKVGCSECEGMGEVPEESVVVPEGSFLVQIPVIVTRDALAAIEQQVQELKAVMVESGAYVPKELRDAVPGYTEEAFLRGSVLEFALFEQGPARQRADHRGR